MTNLKISDLKKYLKEKDSDELINEIVSLVKLFPNVKEYYTNQLVSDSQLEIFERYKKIIKNEFLPDRGFGKMRYSVVNKAIKDYKKVSTNIEFIAQLMLYYVEVGINFTKEFGDIDEKFYMTIENAYEKALDYIFDNDVQKILVDKAHQIKVKSQGIGWGFGDNIADIYYEYYNDDIY